MGLGTMTVESLLLYGLLALVSGALGSLVGLGGGVFVIPALSLLLGVNVRAAIAASMVSIAATSASAAVHYLGSGVASLRLVTILEAPATAGTLLGAFLAGTVAPSVLYLLLGVALAASAVLELASVGGEGAPVQPGAGGPGTPPAGCPPYVLEEAPPPERGLASHYFDPARCEWVGYRPRRVPFGLALMGLTGVVSGMLGIGAGALRVLVLDVTMGVPVKVSIATATTMLGVTAAGGALVYLLRGDVDPFVAAPVVLGMVVGAAVGSHLMPRLRSRTLRIGLGLIVGLLGVRMGWQAFVS